MNAPPLSGAQPPVMSEPRLVATTLLALLVAGSVWLFTGKDGAAREIARPTADGNHYYVYLPSLLLDRDLDLTDEYNSGFNAYGFGRTAIGRPGNLFGIGPALFMIPGFLAGHAVTRLTGQPADGTSPWEKRLSSWTCLLYSLGAIFFAYRLVRRRLRPGFLPLAGAVLAALGGPVVYYAVRQPCYSHPFASFWVAWLVDAWDASFARPGQRPLRTWAALGALLGCAMLARPQLVTWGVLLVPAAWDDLRRAPGPLPRRLAAAGRRAALAGLVAFLVFLPQLLAWQALYGVPYLVPQGAGFMRWDAPAWSEVLLSSRNGLWPWSPAYVLCTLGLVASLRHTPCLTGCLLLAGALQTVINGAVFDWWAGGSFGARRFDSLYVAMAYGGGYLLVRGTALIRRALAAAPARPRGLCAGAALAALGILLLPVLGAGNVVLASKYEVFTARVLGGVPASEILRRRLGPLLGPPAALVSAISNLPARLLFAWRYDTGLDAYDRVVGVHRLGDVHHLEWRQVRDKLPLGVANSPFVAHLVPGPRPRTTRLTAPRARYLVPLNRTGGLQIRVRSTAPEPGSRLQLHWNGTLLADEPASAAQRDTLVTTRDLRRGVNVLTIGSAPGTLLETIALRAVR